MPGPVQKYSGSCHCGRITFELESALNPAVRCNCSLCRRKGAVMVTAVPGTFRIVSGKEHVTLYQFNTLAARHHFCSACGIYTHHNPRTDPTLTRVNAGCLEGVDPLALEAELIDGASFTTVAEGG